MTGFFYEAERERLQNFPDDLAYDVVVKFFTLISSDFDLIRNRTGEPNRLGIAVQIGTLRYLGFIPDDLNTYPKMIILNVAQQINVDPSVISDYGERPQTRTEHIREIEYHLGFKKASGSDLELLEEWLVDRALEHDKPSLLFSMACQRLYADRIVRPGVTLIERTVVTARVKAQEKTFLHLQPLLTRQRLKFLDNILEVDSDKGQTLLSWLRFGATANTPTEILKTIDKLQFLKGSNVENWDLSNINANRRQFLAQIGRRSTNQGLKRANAERRYPILVAFLSRTYQEVIDELVELFDRCLGDCYSRAKGDLKRFHLEIAKTSNEKIIQFRDIIRFVLDPDIPDPILRKRIYSLHSEDELKHAVEECDHLIRPEKDHSYDYLGKRYSYIREFAPRLLSSLEFHSNRQNDPLIKAIDVLRELNESSKRHVPKEAPSKFIQASWQNFIKDDKGNFIRRYYEISVLWELRGALRSGDIWIKNSRRFADPETYLIPKEQWKSTKAELCHSLGLPENGEAVLQEREDELHLFLTELDNKVEIEDGVRIFDKKLVISPLKSEELPDSAIKLQELIDQRLPHIELCDLIVEVDSWVHYSERFEHAGGAKTRTKDFLKILFASLLAQANNFGLEKMERVTGITYAQLAWCTHWYLRDETLQASINDLVNYQFHLPLAISFGGGAMSSSDGQRLPVSVKTRNSATIPKYSGYGRILTFYTWTSDQQSQWQCIPVSSYVRDSTHILDGMLDNETELPLYEHTSDTAGYTEKIFAFFDGLGFLFSPRIKDLGSQSLYSIEKKSTYTNLSITLKGRINKARILKHWDDFLRVWASLKLGWVSASLYISKLEAQPRQSQLAKAFQEYGKLIKSIYIPKYICREDHQKRVTKQLNKGEGLHDLRGWLLFANEGSIHKSQLQDQATQANALTLVTNAIVVWNTRYIQAIIEQLEKEGYEISEEDKTHISPCRFDHINKHGHLNLQVERELSRKSLRPLRNSQ